MTQPLALVIDDEPDICELLSLTPLSSRADGLRVTVSVDGRPLESAPPEQTDDAGRVAQKRE